MVAITHFRTAPKLLGQWAISPSVQGLIALAKCMCPIRYHGGSAKGAEGTAPNSLPEFCREVQPPASLKGLDIPSRRAVFVPWKPSRRPAFGMGNPTFR